MAGPVTYAVDGEQYVAVMGRAWRRRWAGWRTNG